jgi:hypothetical protein
MWPLLLLALVSLVIGPLSCAKDHGPRTTDQMAPPFCAAKLGDFAVHATNAPRFGTPLVSGPEGAAYACFITPSLETVVTRYEPTTGQWSPKAVLAASTRADKFHNQCALGLDPQGFLHAAFNMHDTPWQYAMSTQPHSVQTMVFKGQDAGTSPGASSPADGGCTGTCATNWTVNEPGIAALPGNQVTYPHFATTQDGTLFVAYRECLLCDASFHDRQWSAGLARYSVATGTWTRVAGIRPWATEPGKLPIGLRLAGDLQNRLHAAWVWCNQYTKDEGGQACFAHPNSVTYAVSADHGTSWQQSDGSPLTLPLGVQESEVASGPAWFDEAGAVGYYDGHVALTVDTLTQPTVVVFPNTSDSSKGIKRGYITTTGYAAAAAESFVLRPSSLARDQGQRTRDTTGGAGGQWTHPPRVLDYSPSLVYRDWLGRWIAVSSGLRIHVSTDGGQTWTLWPLALEEGPYDVAWDRAWLRDTHQLRLYAHGNETGRLTIWSLTFPESGRCGS